MKFKFIVLLSLLVGSAYAASPSVVGSFNVRFYLEPARVTGSTQCVTFTQVPGKVAGVATSGTWTSSTFPGWKGEWIQTGDHVRWYGLTNALSTTASGNMASSGIFLGVSFNHFSSTSGAANSAGSWSAVRVLSCPPAPVKPHRFGDDPANG